MAVNPISLVTITRAQDVSVIKHNEDNKAAVAQMNIGQQEDKALKLRSQQVVKKEDTKWSQRKFDAKEKGNNSYNGDGGKGRLNQQNRKSDNKFQQGFDVKI